MLDFLKRKKYVMVIVNVIITHEQVETLMKDFSFHFHVGLLQVRRRRKVKDLCAILFSSNKVKECKAMLSFVKEM